MLARGPYCHKPVFLASQIQNNSRFAGLSFVDNEILDFSSEFNSNKMLLDISSDEQFQVEFNVTCGEKHRQFLTILLISSHRYI